jgi:hypothetical protein
MHENLARTGTCVNDYLDNGPEQTVDYFRLVFVLVLLTAEDKTWALVEEP